MKKFSIKKTVNSLLCFLLISAIISCDQLDNVEQQNDPEIPARSASAKSGNLKATISPASGTTLTSNSVNFSWDHPGGYYWLDIGTTLGGEDIFTNTAYFQTKSYTVSNLPGSGKIYFRLWYYVNSKWEYNDYNYTMNPGGSSSSMSPASGSSLTENSVRFSWTHSADYYRIYFGTTAGEDDLYDSGDLTTKSHTVQNIPQSGTVYLRLWLNINGSWAEKFDYTYSAQSSGGGSGGDKDFIITCVNDDLDPSDMTDFANGMRRLGYTQALKNSNVSSSQLKSYFGRSVKTLYHTGHGSEGYISTSDGGLRVGSVSSVANENLIIATCLTLKDKSWKNKFVSTTKNIMGYTNYSYDYVDNTVVKNMISKLESGKSYLQAWYEVNSKESYLFDRWCSYTRSGNSVVEYSAVSGNTPRAVQPSGSFYSLANGRVQVSSAISNATKSASPAFTSRYSATKDQEASFSTQDFNTLVKCNISEQEAIVKAQSWVSSIGTFTQVEFDKVISLYADGTVIGHQVRFKRVINSLSVRGNSITDYVSLLITDNNIVTTQYNWSSITPSLVKSSIDVLSAKEAIEAAADAIASRYKGSVVKISQAVKCLGYKASESGISTLVPAYEFISTDGSGIVIDAETGNIL